MILHTCAHKGVHVECHCLKSSLSSSCLGPQRETCLLRSFPLCGVHRSQILQAPACSFNLNEEFELRISWGFCSNADCGSVSPGQDTRSCVSN